MSAHVCLREWGKKGRRYCRTCFDFNRFIIIIVLFVVSIIQILLVLQHASEIQSSEMLHVAIQYHCVLLYKEKSALWDYFCVAFTSNCKYSFDRRDFLFCFANVQLCGFFLKHFALYEKSRTIQECPTTLFKSSRREFDYINRHIIDNLERKMLYSRETIFPRNSLFWSLSKVFVSIFWLRVVQSIPPRVLAVLL